MKAVLIAVGTFVVIIAILMAYVVVKISGSLHQAQTQALYTSLGSWKRIQEYARAEGKSNYIAEADRMVGQLEGELTSTRQNGGSKADVGALEKMRTQAYETTDSNIKKGINPLAYLDASDDLPALVSKKNGSAKSAGMSEFEYLAADGGPHLVLPKELSNKWKGTSLLSLITDSGDYGRACKAVANQEMAVLAVGKASAMVLSDPPLSAWGHSPEGWVDIYYLAAWPDTNADAMLKRAVAATPTSAMRDTGQSLTLKSAGLILLYAGDQPGKAEYGEFAIPIDAGTYEIFLGKYKPATNEEVHVYRLKPKEK